MELVIKLDTLNVAGNEGQGQWHWVLILSTAWTDFVGAWFVWMLTFIDLDGGWRTLDFPLDREP